MATKNGTSEKGKIKVRFFEVELEGGDETLLEGIKTIAVAMNRTTPTRVLQAPQSAARVAPLPSNEALTGDVVSHEEAEEALEMPEETAEVSTSPRKRNNRSFSVPKQLEDLDLNNGNPTWADFATNKNPSNIMEKALVMAIWLRDHRKVVEFGKDHIYTCFKWMKWPLPEDVAGILRSMKKLGYAKPTSDGKYGIQMMGEKKFNEI